MVYKHEPELHRLDAIYGNNHLRTNEYAIPALLAAGPIRKWHIVESSGLSLYTPEECSLPLTNG